MTEVSSDWEKRDESTPIYIHVIGKNKSEYIFI